MFVPGMISNMSLLKLNLFLIKLLAKTNETTQDALLGIRFLKCFLCFNY